MPLMLYERGFCLRDTGRERKCSGTLSAGVLSSPKEKAPAARQVQVQSLGKIDQRYKEGEIGLPCIW